MHAQKAMAVKPCGMCFSEVSPEAPLRMQRPGAERVAGRRSVCDSHRPFHLFLLYPPGRHSRLIRSETVGRDGDLMHMNPMRTNEEMGLVTPGVCPGLLFEVVS